MTSGTLSITLTAIIDPPLDPEDARSTGNELAARLDAKLVSTGADDRGWHSWQLAAVPGEPDLGRRAAVATVELRRCTPPGCTVVVHGVEVLDTTEVERRLAARSGDPADQVRAPARELPPIPEVRSTSQVAERLGVTPSRVRQLRAERQAADEQGDPHPFPREAMPGFYYADEIETYAEHGRRAPGRPRTVDEFAAAEAARRAPGEAAAAALTASGDGWRNVLPGGARIVTDLDGIPRVWDTVELATGDVLYRTGDEPWTLMGRSNASKARRYRPAPEDLRPFDPTEHDPHRC